MKKFFKVRFFCFFPNPEIEQFTIWGMTLKKSQFVVRTPSFIESSHVITQYTQFFYKHVSEFLGYKLLKFLPFLTYKLLKFLPF